MTVTAAWLNGTATAALPVCSRGLQYGDGVFRTLLKYDRQFIDLEEHVKKINADAQRLELAGPDPMVLRSEIHEAAARESRCVVKIMLMRAGTGRGYRPQTSTADRLVMCSAAPAYPLSCWEQGIAAFRGALFLAAQPALAGIKHLNRLEQVLASPNWPAGADEALLCDEGGAPVCGSRSNLFWVRRQQLHTPLLDRCGVAGLMRDKVLGLATRLGIAAAVVRGTWQELLEADEAFVTNSLIGIWPLRALDDHAWAAPGPVTAALVAALQHPRLA